MPTWRPWPEGRRQRAIIPRRRGSGSADSLDRSLVVTGDVAGVQSDGGVHRLNDPAVQLPAGRELMPQRRV